MSAQALLPHEAERLRHADFTYAEVGATRHGVAPSGYGQLRRSRRLGVGPERFEQAARTLLGWDMHRHAGVHLRASGPRVAEGAVAILRLGIGALSVAAPVRVVYVVDEPHRQGFAYGTLPGHPESGEEAFLVHVDRHGRVSFTITAFSRPATLLTRATGPLSRGLQSWVTNRYLRAL